MAKNTAAAATAVAKVVTTTETESNKGQASAGASYVPVASLLQRGYTFLRLKSTPDGRYTIPGKDFDKRGEAGNGKHLMLPGGAILVNVPQNVWEEIKATKQNLPLFKHEPPYLQELKSEKDFKAKMDAGEFKDVRTGFESIDPNKAGVKADKS